MYMSSLPVAVESIKAFAEPAWRICDFFMRSHHFHFGPNLIFSSVEKFCPFNGTVSAR